MAYNENDNLLNGSLIEVDSIKCKQLNVSELNKYKTYQVGMFHPSHGDTAGANNCYWAGNGVRYGTNALGTGYNTISIMLPENYVEGSDFILCLIIGPGGNMQTDYSIQYNIFRNGVPAIAGASSPVAGNWPGLIAGNQYLKKIILNGSGFLRDDFLRVMIFMDDNAGAQIIDCTGAAIKVKINKNVG